MNKINYHYFNKVLDVIYTYLDPQARKNLGSSCLEIHSLYLRNQKLLNLAKKLITEYDIHASYPESRPIWYALKINQFFLFGEDHTKPEHRQIFAIFVHAIWENGFSLLVEMPSDTKIESLDLEKGPLKYVNKEIAETAKGWDSKSEARTKIFAEAYGKIFILLSSLLQVQDEITEEEVLKKIENLIFKIKTCLPGDCKWNNINDIYLSQLQSLIKIMNQSDPTDRYFCNYKYKKSYVIYDLAIKIQSISYKSIEDIDNMLMEQAKERDNSMFVTLENEKKIGHRVILESGLHHVQEKRNEYKVIERLRNKKEPFLVLHPKDIKNAQEIESIVSQEKIKLSDDPSTRELLKSFNPSDINHFDDLYRFISTEPLKIISNEIKYCGSKYDETEIDYNKYWK